MSDEKNVNVDNSVSFADYLGIHISKGGNASICYNQLSAEDQRVMAVACALELIRASSSGEGHVTLKANMDKLSAFAKEIEHALRA